MRIYNLFFNKIYPKVFAFLYKKRFISIGKNSYVQYPYLSINTKNINIGKNSYVLSNSRIESFSSDENHNPTLYIGDNTSIHYNFTALIGEDVFIGDDVTIASNVLVTSENHSIDPLSKLNYKNQKLQIKKVIINDGVWIGEKAIILPGVTIGKKSVIGAGSVVTKSIPDYSIAVGNPAKVVKKYNFSEKKWENI